MKKRGGSIAILASAIGLVAVAPAQATTVTIGSPGPAATTSATINTPATVVNTVIPSAAVTAPANGVITSWKIANPDGSFALQVVHPSGGNFVSTASTAPATFSGSGIFATPADLAIAKGDLIGLNNTTSAQLGASVTPGSTFVYFAPPLGGSARPSDGDGAAELGFNAQVLLNCIVPKLKGKKVGAAKNALATAGCTPPTVKQGKRKGKFVRKQNPAAGTEIRGDAAVTLTKGPKAKKKK